MNIIYIYRSLTAFGGVERIFTDKANYLAEKLGHSVYIITFEQGKHPIPYSLSDKVKHFDLDICFYRQYQYGKLKRLQMQMQMEKEFRHKLAELVMRINAEIIICASCEFTVMKIVTGLKLPVKKIIESHGAKKYIEKASCSNGIAKFLFKFKDKMLHHYIKKADAFIVLTNNDGKDWNVVRHTEIIPNLLTKYPDVINQIPKLEKRVISVGRLTEQKGYDLLIEAWKLVHEKHRDWTLDIYGAGEDENKLERQVKESGLEAHIYIHEPTSQIYDKYMESDFYVLSSRWEGFGLVLSEAMSCGIPCVSFDCPHGPSDIISDREDGLLVENGNISQLAEKICYLIENEDIRIEMGRKARENVKRYLPENIMPQWVHLFETITKHDN